MSSEPDEYLTPVKSSSSEISVRGSRFLALVIPVVDETSARKALRELEQEYSDATHVCWAWRMGFNGLSRSSDAGEPAGTAGRPILRALESANVSDALLVVVRWFGGTKLGRGGLVRAYGGSARAAINVADLERRKRTATIDIETDYPTWNQVERVIVGLGGSARAEFGERVRARVTIPVAAEPDLRQRLADLGVVIARA